MPQKLSLRWSIGLALWLLTLFATVSCIDATLRRGNNANGGTGVAIDFVVRLRGIALLPPGSGGHLYLGHGYDQLLLSYGAPNTLGALYLYSGAAEGLDGSRQLPAEAIALTSAFALRQVINDPTPLFQMFNEGVQQIGLSTVDFKTRDNQTVSYLFTKTESIARIAPGSGVTHVCAAPALSAYAALQGEATSPQISFVTPVGSTLTFLPATKVLGASTKVYNYVLPGGGFYEVTFSDNSRSCSIRARAENSADVPAFTANGTLLTPSNDTNF